jgi:excisionase family DNA binding protein
MRGASFSFFRLLSGTSRRKRMAVRIIFEVNEHHLDELGNGFLEAIRSVIRDEIERTFASRTASQRAIDPEHDRPVALSKSKAAQALGVSVRTLDNCIAQKGIRVVRIGRRVLVPIHSIEAALKHGTLETHSNNLTVPK